MADERVIRFVSAKFDIRRERENPINPIAGESVLRWLRDEVAPALNVSEPEPEDWGWYAAVTFEGRTYMLGASVSQAEAGSKPEWVVQIVKQRTFGERLMGRARMSADDPCAGFFEDLIRREAAFEDVTVDT